MDEQDLERTLRATFDARAATVDHGPSWAGGDVDTSGDHVGVRRRGGARHPRWLVLAATAAVVLTAGGAYALRNVADNRAAAGRTSLCSAALPSSWLQAVQPVPFGVGTFDTALVTPAPGGGVVLLVDGGGADRLVFVPLHGGPKTLLTLAAGHDRVPGHDRVRSIAVDATWVLVTLEADSSTYGTTVTDILAVDSATGESRRIAHSPISVKPSVVLDDAAIAHGSVYWVTRPTPSSLVETVHRQVLRSKSSTVIGHAAVARHAAYGPYPPSAYENRFAVSPVGVFLLTSSASIPAPKDKRVVAFALPEVVAANTHAAYVAPFVVSDGSAYGWTEETPYLDWWGPGRTQAVRYHRDYARFGPVLGVAGPMLVIRGGSDEGEHNVRTRIVDTRTGATGDLGLWTAGTGGAVFLAGADGASLGRLDVTALPALQC